MQHRYALALLLSLTACGGSKASPDAPPAADEGPRTIALRLEPPAQIEGTMNLQGQQLNNGRESDLALTYTLSTYATEDGVALAFSQARDVETSLPQEQRVLLLPLLQAIPTIVLHDGAIKRIDGFDEFRASMDLLLADAYEKLPGTKEQMDKLLTEELLLASVRDDWDWRGAAFHGKSMAVGQVDETIVELPVPLLPKSVKAVMTMSLVEQLPCPGNADRECVKLQRTLVADAEAWRAVMGDMLGDQEMEKTVTVELVAEPATLLPHRFEKTEETLFRDGDGEVVSQRSSRKHVVETYDWNRQ